MLAIFQALLCISIRLASAKDDRVKDWELNWIHGSIAAKDLSADAVVKLTKARNVGLGLRTPRQPYYTEVDLNQDRMAPICQVRFQNPEAGRTPYCSCAFIADDLVATAAHCLVENRVTPTSGGQVFVIQGYGKGGSSKKFQSFHRNLVTDYWFPKEFAKYQAQSQGSAYNIAFLKTKEKVSKFYTLSETPVDYGLNVVAGGKYMVVGYPLDFRNAEVAVSTTGTLSLDEEVGGLLDLTNDYVVKGREVGTVHPMMTTGGAGGPVLSANGELGNMKLFSVLGVSIDEETIERQNIRIANQSIMLIVTRKLVDVAAHIHKKGLQGAEVKETRENGEQVVKLTV